MTGTLPVVGGTPPLRAVLFDAGLTLLRSSTPWESVAQDALRSLGDDAPEAGLKLAMSDALAHLESVWHHGDWWSAEPDVRRLFVSAYEKGLTTHLGTGRDRSWPRRVANSIYDAYQNTRYWSLYGDVEPTLQALSVHGVRMGVVSDWGHGLEAILLELGLGNYLEFLVVSSRLGVSKPDPRVFRMALNRIDAVPEEALYIGDTYLKDVLGARAAGIAPVLLDRDGIAPVLDCPRVGSLLDLLELVGIQPETRGTL